LILVFLIVIVGIFINAQEHAFIANMISILFVVGHSSLNLYYFAAENQEIIPEKSMLRA